MLAVRGLRCVGEERGCHYRNKQPSELLCHVVHSSQRKGLPNNIHAPPDLICRLLLTSVALESRFDLSDLVEDPPRTLPVLII